MQNKVLESFVLNGKAFLFHFKKHRHEFHDGLNEPPQKCGGTKIPYLIVNFKVCSLNAYKNSI